MMKGYILLISMFFAALGNGAEVEHAKPIRNELEIATFCMELAATKQFEYLSSSLDDKFVRDEVYAIHASVEAYCSGLNEATFTSAEKKVMSQIYSRIGWFEYLDKKKSDIRNVEEALGYLRKAKELDADNAVVYYQLSECMNYMGTTESSSAFEFLQKSLEIRPLFAEASLSMCMSPNRGFVNDADIYIYREACKIQENYCPELFFFDDGYPPLQLRILIDGGNGKPVQMKRVDGLQGRERFKIKVEEVRGSPIGSRVK